jgi:hypothetical protein
MPTLFNSLDDIKKDIIDRMDNYLKTIYDSSVEDKDIIALLRNYIWQLKTKEEINDYRIVKYKKNIININIYNSVGDSLEFNINLDVELRKIKIIKIKDKKP